MQRGTRWIDGREYLLAGRETSKEQAAESAATLRKRHARVRIVKISNWDYMLYIHG